MIVVGNFSCCRHLTFPIKCTIGCSMQKMQRVLAMTYDYITTVQKAILSEVSMEVAFSCKIITFSLLYQS